MWGGVCLVCVISRLSRVWNVLHAISSFSAIKIRRILLLNMYSYCIQQQQQLVIMVIYPPISFDLSTGENPLIWALVKILLFMHLAVLSARIAIFISFYKNLVCFMYFEHKGVSNCLSGLMQKIFFFFFFFNWCFPQFLNYNIENWVWLDFDLVAAGTFSCCSLLSSQEFDLLGWPSTSMLAFMRTQKSFPRW